MKTTELLTFAPEEIETLRRESETAIQYVRHAGLHFQPRQEKRYLFVQDWISDRVFISERTINLARRIKRELTEARNLCPANFATLN